MRLHSQTSVRWPSTGLVAETLQATRDGFGPGWISWNVDAVTSAVTVTGPDGDPKVTPIRLTSGAVARPGSTYVLDVEGLTVGQVCGTLSGSGLESVPERADVALDYRSAGRGRAVASVTLLPPYGLTSRSDVPELRWDATVTDGRQARAHADVRLLWAASTAEALVDADRSLLDVTVSFGPTGIWRPLLGPVLWFSRKRIVAGFEAWCTQVADSINRGLPEELARIRTAAHSSDPVDPVTETVDAPAPPLDLDPWVALAWLRSPVTVLRHVYRQARTPAVTPGR